MIWIGYFLYHRGLSPPVLGQLAWRTMTSVQAPSRSLPRHTKPFRSEYAHPFGDILIGRLPHRASGDIKRVRPPPARTYGARHLSLSPSSVPISGGRVNRQVRWWLVYSPPQPESDPAPALRGCSMRCNQLLEPVRNMGSAPKESAEGYAEPARRYWAHNRQPVLQRAGSNMPAQRSAATSTTAGSAATQRTNAMVLAACSKR